MNYKNVLNSIKLFMITNLANNKLMTLIIIR